MSTEGLASSSEVGFGGRATPAEAGHAVGSTRLFVTVWVWLAAITGFEVFLGYERLRPAIMLSLLVILSFVKAALIVAYFMHLKYEKIGLALMLIPAALFCMMMIIIFFMPDSLRILQLGHP